MNKPLEQWQPGRGVLKMIKTRYKYVYKVLLRNGEFYYHAQMVCKGNRTCQAYNDIRLAAKKVDLFLISHGKEPVNILKLK